MSNFTYNHPWTSLFIGLTLLLSVTTILVMSIVKYDCQKLGTNTGKYTEFHFFGAGGDSCLIRINSVLVPKSVWMNNEGK